MDLKEYYEKLPHSSSPKMEFVRDLTRNLGVTETAVRNWIQGRARPADKEHIKYISKVTQIPAEDLFPSK